MKRKRKSSETWKAFMLYKLIRSWNDTCDTCVFEFPDIVTQDIPGKRQSGALKGDVQVYKRESMQYYHNVVGKSFTSPQTFCF